MKIDSSVQLPNTVSSMGTLNTVNNLLFSSQSRQKFQSDVFIKAPLSSDLKNRVAFGNSSASDVSPTSYIRDIKPRDYTRLPSALNSSGWANVFSSEADLAKAMPIDVEKDDLVKARQKFSNAVNDIVALRRANFEYSLNEKIHNLEKVLIQTFPQITVSYTHLTLPTIYSV